MENRAGKKVKMLIGLITALVFIVIIFAFFTFSEDNHIGNYNGFQNVLANAKPQSKSSSGIYSFVKKSSSDVESGSEESSDSTEELENTESESSSAKKSSSSSKQSSSKSSSEKSSETLKESNSSAESSSSSASSSDSSSSEVSDTTDVSIIGENVLTREQLLAYTSANRDRMQLTCTLEELIDHYLTIGARYGIRGDIAFLQALRETGWFKYARPSSYLVYRNGRWVRVYEPRPEGLYVVASDNNFCGLGVTGRLGDEDSLCRFATAALGVEAQIQHLYAYACNESLPEGTELVDPRFQFVSRGCAPTWESLGNGNWATDTYYGMNIISVYYNVLENY